MDEHRLVDTLRNAQHVVVFTGAGISAESGIPTYRDALTGLWENFDFAELATPTAFRRDPSLVWGWYEWRRMNVMRAEPNPAHLAIAAMAMKVPRFTLITQNVDNLHERAGSNDVIHLHGSLFMPRCFACARPHEFSSKIPVEPQGGRRLEPPRCLHCGGGIRPGVVWFSESLPRVAWTAAMSAVERGGCDLFFSIGTSAMVYPAAELPFLAIGRRATVVQINPDFTELDQFASINFHSSAANVLPRLVEASWPPR
jgi:NAD-dependent deacetylase